MGAGIGMPVENQTGQCLVTAGKKGVMKMLRIKISTENAAFRDPRTGEYDERYEGYEICRILRGIIQKIEDGGCAGGLYDLNGNRVGEWVR